jgi:hypothetical protein
MTKMTWIQDGWKDGVDVADLERIVSAFKAGGIEIDRFDAYCAWSLFSEDMFAGWLMTRSYDDESIRNRCLPYLKKCEASP